MALKFLSKAQNLKQLKPLLKSAEILPLVITKAKDRQKALLAIQSLGSEYVIIRSSSCNEDSQECSNAGAFLSLANIKNEESSLLKALDEVADSMPNDEDEILIQPMLNGITLCGVGFSVDKENFSPYFCLQYDKSGSSSGITDGTSKEVVSFFHYRFVECKNPQMQKIIALILELESLFECNYLDVEFAMTKEDKLYCLQVRPLVMKDKINLYEFVPLEALKRLQKRFINLQKPALDVYGERAIFGVMPDWNPAEIIGLRPKRLALSLYKEIITDNIWAYQRDNYGYLNLRSHPLMHSFLGIPYIDVRLSFNSFIPKSLDKKITKKLVDYYLQSLTTSPHLHDKIEFDVVFSCYDLNTPKKLQKLLDFGFNENEIKRLEFSLLELTNSIIKHKKGLYLKDIKKIKRLKAYYEEIKESSLPLIDKIYWLIEECKRYGTLPFAGVARAGFVAVSMLNSLVEIGIFTPALKESFLNSLKSVSKQLSEATKNLNETNKEEFLREFGHLRAGTYNILSPRYDEAFLDYFNDVLKVQVEKQSVIEETFCLNDKQKKELDNMLCENGLEVNAEEFLKFLRLAIEGREYAKFEFTKLLSLVLVYIGELGEYYGISKEDIAHLDIKNILSLYSSLYSKNPRERFLDEIERHKEEYKITQALKLPSLLCNDEEIFSFFSSGAVANFITQKSITAFVALEKQKDIKGKIVLIYAADPGYDYLFAKEIAGFITCYGGANSHMAIRASEIGLPAAIGVGEEAFNQYLQSKKLTLDCQSGQILCLL